ncbi:MAG: hypothetical protein RBT72_06180 [Spirochaetia bacterium]|nr:hypothetical protein [Spirochaetia bacterium]
MDKAIAEAGVGYCKATDLSAVFIVQQKSWHRPKTPKGYCNESSQNDGSRQQQPFFTFHSCRSFKRKESAPKP